MAVQNCGWPEFDTRLQRLLESMRLTWRDGFTASHAFPGNLAGPDSGLPTRVSLTLVSRADRNGIRARVTYGPLVDLYRVIYEKRRRPCRAR